MSRKVKNYSVEALKNYTNRQLANENIIQEAKKELCSLLECVLFETGNYSGFNYIKWTNDGCDKWFKDVDSGLVDVFDYDAKRAYLGNEYDRIYY